MIFLREYADSDLERLVNLANNENVARYLVSTFPHPYTNEDAKWWIGTGSRQNGAITRVIEYQGLFVGSVSINLQSGWRDHLGEIGYWVAEDYSNVASMRVLEKCGYQREAILKNEVQKHGTYFDTHHFARHR
jgi:[ribosomal protein S5]-alanine N-acetyltransferase